MDQDQGLENLSCHPYTLIPALDEGFFTDITFVSSSGKKVFGERILLLTSKLIIIIYLKVYFK